MYLKPTFAFLSAVLTLVMAGPTPTPMVVHEERKTVPDGFVRSGPANPETALQLTIGLPSNDRDGLVNSLYDVSDPESASYGKHLSKEQVEAFVKPTSDTLDVVHAWLSEHGIKATTISPAGDLVSITTTVSAANALLSTSFETFTHVSSGTQYIRTLSYSIPATVKAHIDFVHPTITFTPPFGKTPAVLSSIPQKGNSAADAVPPACTDGVTPSCLQELYGIPTTPASQSSNTLAVPEFNNEFASEDDLETFLTTYRPDLPSSTTFTILTLNGGQNLTAPAGLEANLDIQYTVGVASQVPTTLISVGTDNGDGIIQFLDIANYLLSLGNPPTVMTTSYIFNEESISQNFATKLCDAYMQLGARGVSVLFSSGDGGVSGWQSASCTSFVPTFPSSCPFVTSVGATTSFSPETAATLSSGGFSNYFSIPSYQSASASAYLNALGATNQGLFNQSGRGFPDVSAQGQDVLIVLDGEIEPVQGTSASSPIFASIIALLNDLLIADSQPPLGFLNPFLYSQAGSAALTDVTSGDNPGCNTNGFPATAGWDPVTGLGTPNFNLLKAAIGL